MKNFRMAVSLGLSLIGANAAFADSIYEKVLDCDGGAAVVDRNRLSPAYPQVVIRNPQIVEYLASQGAIQGGGEIILTGRNDQDVYQSSDFHGFSDVGSGTYRLDWVRREGNGIRVSINRYEEVANSDCGRDIPSSNPTCQGRFREVANWVFVDCR
jgi:hypothetical protein